MSSPSSWASAAAAVAEGEEGEEARVSRVLWRWLRVRVRRVIRVVLMFSRREG